MPDLLWPGGALQTTAGPQALLRNPRRSRRPHRECQEPSRKPPHTEGKRLLEEPTRGAEWHRAHGSECKRAQGSRCQGTFTPAHACLLVQQEEIRSSVLGRAFYRVVALLSSGTRLRCCTLLHMHVSCSGRRHLLLGRRSRGNEPPPSREDHAASYAEPGRALSYAEPDRALSYAEPHRTVSSPACGGPMRHAASGAWTAPQRRGHEGSPAAGCSQDRA